MRRRDFLSAGAGVMLGPALGAASTAAQPATQQPGATPAGRVIEVPGIGPVSLDPADYDATKIAAMFQRDFPTAVGLIRDHYADAVKTLSGADTQQMAKLAGPLIQQASKASALPFIGKGLEEALMSPPQPIALQQGAGPQVYYVNGIFTDQATAKREATLLATRLAGRPVSLLYNEGTPPSVNQQLAGKDLEEAYRDRVWPVYLTGLLSGKSLAAGLTATLGGGSPLQHNPTTRQLASVLYRHATQTPDAPIAVVGYSQGSMIVRNALFTLALLGKQDFVEKRVAFVAPGLPINDQEVWPVPKKFTPIIDPQDPVPAFLGLQGTALQTKNAMVEHHGWFDNGYGAKITPAMVTLSA